MNWLISHGILEIITAIILFLVGVMVNSLRSTIRQHQEAVNELAKTVALLNVTISKEYITRAEVEKNNRDLWDRMNRHDTRITKISDRVTHLEARENNRG